MSEKQVLSEDVFVGSVLVSMRRALAQVETYGAELAAHSGYKYFGAAKDLPGVRELFETEIVPDAPRKTRQDSQRAAAVTCSRGKLLFVFFFFSRGSCLGLRQAGDTG